MPYMHLTLPNSKGQGYVHLDSNILEMVSDMLTIAIAVKYEFLHEVSTLIFTFYFGQL